MAHHLSAKKRIRQTVKRSAINRSRISRIRTYVKKVERAIANNEKSRAEEALKTAESELARGVTKGVVHRNTAARKTSRLVAAVKAMGANGGT
jgi:small subunit ribosomal protein S20